MCLLQDAKSVREKSLPSLKEAVQNHMPLYHRRLQPSLEEQWERVASNTDNSELTRQVKFLGNVVYYLFGLQVPSVPS